MSAEERSDWRDKEISNQHRQWGFNCPAVDLDFVMLEYNNAKPCALVEYKHWEARPPDKQHATYRALVALADGYRDGPLPCFVARYNPATWEFRVMPLNERAREHYKHCTDEWIPRHRFVTSLHLLRKRVLDAVDKAVIRRLKAEDEAAIRELNGAGSIAT